MSKSIKELITIRDLIRWAVSAFNKANLFYGHGTDNAWDEAVYLVLHALHLPLNTGTQVLDAHITEKEKKEVLQLIQQRVKKHTPAAYLTHEAYFAGLKFYVDERTLIPRSPLAELIEQQFSPWIEEAKVHHILDLCTGSGCIAIACAYAFPRSEVDAVDNSIQALDVAKRNVRDHDLNQRVRIYTSNLFQNLPEKRYDIIISNPPYVPLKEWEKLPEEYHHEPKAALVAGKDGLDIVSQILKESSRFLNPHGILVVEVGNSEEAVKEKYPEFPFVWLEFERGGGGVFLLTKDELLSSHEGFS